MKWLKMTEVVGVSIQGKGAKNGNSKKGINKGNAAAKLPETVSVLET